MKWQGRVQAQTLSYLPVVEKISPTIIQKGLVMKEIAFAAIMGREYASVSTVIFVFFFWRFLRDEGEFSSLLPEIKRKWHDLFLF